LTLVAQTASILRDDLQRGEWKDSLPSELALCDRLQVSRITVRAALEILRREGWIDASKGRRRRILRESGSVTPLPRSAVVGLVSSIPFHSFAADGMYRVGELRRHLQSVDCRLEVFADTRIASKDPSRLLDQIVRDTRARCWVLVVSTPQMQRWFEARQLPAVIMGPQHDGVQLPFVDLHNRAMSRHAIGTCASMGHRRIALFVPRRGEVGTLHLEEGFREGARLLRRPDIEPQIVYHDDSPEGIGVVLRRLLRQRNRPGVLLVSRSKVVIGVLAHLAQMQLRVPKDVSLVALSDQDYLSMITPPLTRYRYNHKQLADALFHIVLERVRDPQAPIRSAQIMSRFFRGETLARLDAGGTSNLS
jgi:LacI family transcriptional regulator